MKKEANGILNQIYSVMMVNIRRIRGGAFSISGTWILLQWHVVFEIHFKLFTSNCASQSPAIKQAAHSADCIQIAFSMYACMCSAMYNVHLCIYIQIHTKPLIVTITTRKFIKRIVLKTGYFLHQMNTNTNLVRLYFVYITW